MANQNPAEKFAYLDQLSTEELEELIRADVGSPENTDAEAIFHVLEVLNKRAEEDPDGVTFDKARVWHDIQTVYNVPEGQERSLYPLDDEDDEDGDGRSAEAGVVPLDPAPAAKKRPRFRWGLSVAAAAILVFSVTMVGAQASGLDVFGFLARWTQEVFAYKPESEYYPAIEDAFVQNHFPDELVPKWYPAGFEPTEPEVFEENSSTAIFISFSNSSKDKIFSILVRRYSSPESLLALDHQRDPDSQHQHTSGDKTFFLVSNEGHSTATWSDRQKYVMTISGDLSLRDTEKIIDSIGG